MSPSPTGPKLVELRPNRDLLNAHFEGYKLTLQPLPKLRSALVQPPGRRHTSDDQYSYLHAQLFSTHNHLVRDPYTPGAYYYVDAAGAVHCVRYAADSGRLAEHVRPVFGAPAAGIERYAGDYNATLTFVSGKCAVLADGSGGLSVLETGDRQRQETADETWKLLHAFRPLDDNVATDDDDDSEVPAAAAPFVLLDARLDVEGLYRRVHAVLLHIVKRPDDHTFETVLDWVLVSQQTASNWQCTRLKRLRSRCMPAYCALEARGAALLLAGDQPFVLAGLDDQQSVATVATAIDAELPFGWHQNAEDVIVRFDVPAGAQTADFRVVTERRRVCVTNTGTAGAAVCLLDAELYGDIDAGLTTWLLENETLTLTLVKAGGINGTVDADAVPEEWPQLRRNVVGPPAAEFLDNGRRDAFAMASAGAEMEDMEECDLGGNDAGREFFLGECGPLGVRMLFETEILTPTFGRTPGRRHQHAHAPLFAGHHRTAVHRPAACRRSSRPRFAHGR